MSITQQDYNDVLADDDKTGSPAETAKVLSFSYINWLNLENVNLRLIIEGGKISHNEKLGSM